MSLSSRKAMRQTIDRIASGEVIKRATSKSPARTKKASSAKPADWTKDLFSPNPDKAWAEKFYIKYSLVWPLLFGGWAASGYHLLVGDFGNLLASILIAAPTFVIPYLYAPPLADNRQWYERFWFKYLLWLFIFTFVATYFWSEYFFDVLGMKYAFEHLKWNFDAILVGTGRQRVPLMMLVRFFGIPQKKKSSNKTHSKQNQLNSIQVLTLQIIVPCLVFLCDVSHLLCGIYSICSQ